MNWSERDLDLFKTKRQRGTVAPPAEEFDLHCLLADVLKRWCSAEWRYTHLPMGEYRPPATAGRLKRMGVTPGWPDFVFFHENGRVCWLELKRGRNKPTQTQDELAQFLSRCGHFYFWTSSFDAALKWLKKHGIVPSKIINNTSKRDAAPCATMGDDAIG